MVALTGHASTQEWDGLRPKDCYEPGQLTVRPTEKSKKDNSGSGALHTKDPGPEWDQPPWLEGQSLGKSFPLSGLRVKSRGVPLYLLGDGDGRAEQGSQWDRNRPEQVCVAL